MTPHSAGLESIFTERDTHQYGEPEIERGGKWMYFVPGLGVRLSDRFILDVEYPWNIYYDVNESQLVPNWLLRFNLFYEWTLR